MPIDLSDNLLEYVNCLSEIAAIVENSNVESVFVLGDFNSHPGELFGKEMINFCYDQNWICADMQKLGESSGTYTFVSEAHGCRRWLDHCLVTEAAWRSITSINVLYDVFWSDHFPLEIQCNFSTVKPKIDMPCAPMNKVIWGERTPSQIETYNRRCNESLKQIEFPQELSQCCDNICDNCSLEHRSVIDNLYKSIVSSLMEAASYSHKHSDCQLARKSKGRRCILGWNKHVRGAHWDARQKFLNWVWFGKPRQGTIYEEMWKSRQYFKQKLKYCQDNQVQIKLNIIASKHQNKDFRGFWKETKKLSPKTGLPVSVESAKEPKEIANLFKDHFQVQLSSRPVRGATDSGGIVSSVPSRITTNNVCEILKGMKRGKSPGHDGLSVEHLVHAGPHLPRLLALLFTICIRHSYLPAELMRTVVVPIIKNKTGDITDKSNYRPISLATVAAKVFDGLLERQLKEHILIHDAQFGFRPGVSTDCAILSLKHTVRYYTDRSTPVYAAFLDLSKAFDLVRYDILWAKLTDAGVPQEVINIFKYWYDHQINQVKWGNVLSDEYGLKSGVRQGGLTSPALFNLYINQLITELSSTGVGCSIDGHCVNSISYADDMVLLSPSVSALRKLLAICERYAQEHGLQYNVKKSELLVFRVGSQKPAHVPPVTLEGVELRRVSHFKYLGHIVTEDLKDDYDMERERRAIAVRCNMLARRFARCTLDVKITLFKAFCQTLYTCGLWVNYTQKTYNALRVQYNNAFRVMLGLPRHCSASAMFAYAYTDDFYSVMRKRVASLMRRVRGSTNAILRVVSEKPDCRILRHWVHTHVYVPSASVRTGKYLN
ncbi:uncharacterized protein [Maniola hyperantus]|uniref:uncharacterized protein n=1 Tax=Aphantopus hyperantus TaxID=2795564 RepID=UPI003747E7B4